MDYNSRLYFANYHGLVGPMQWNELIKQCCTDCDRVSIREQIINTNILLAQKLEIFIKVMFLILLATNWRCIIVQFEPIISALKK